jgi:hypothetical protein
MTGLNPAARGCLSLVSVVLLSGKRLIPHPEEVCWVYVYATECDKVQQSPPTRTPTVDT